MKIIMHDGSIEEHSFDEEIGKSTLRHTASHILAQAVKRLFPDTKLAIGPAIKDGFYYDFDRDHPFTEQELEQLEAEMKKIVKENLKLERFTLPRKEAIALMEEHGVETISDLKESDRPWTAALAVWMADASSAPQIKALMRHTEICWH